MRETSMRSPHDGTSCRGSTAHRYPGRPGGRNTGPGRVSQIFGLLRAARWALRRTRLVAHGSAMGSSPGTPEHSTGRLLATAKIYETRPSRRWP
jgi:hypothetical protein